MVIVFIIIIVIIIIIIVAPGKKKRRSRKRMQPQNLFQCTPVKYIYTEKKITWCFDVYKILPLMACWMPNIAVVLIIIIIGTAAAAVFTLFSSHHCLFLFVFFFVLNLVFLMCQYWQFQVDNNRYESIYFYSDRRNKNLNSEIRRLNWMIITNKTIAMNQIHEGFGRKIFFNYDGAVYT